MDPTLTPVFAGIVPCEAPARSTWPAALPDDSNEVIDWTEEQIVFLHWLLLKELNQLRNPAAPLEEKLDTLRWLFTEPHLDDRPFSFVNCVRVVACSPLSPTDYFGGVDADAVRVHVERHVCQWLRESLLRYPAWVRRLVADHPAWVERQLRRNPQWINEQLKRTEDQGDLFSGTDA